MDPFRDKVAVITGGASGIGRAIGAQLAARGARVWLSDIDADKLAEAAAEQRATARVTDVRDPGAVQALVDAAVDEHGRIDYLFNNAGIAIIGEVLDMDLDHWTHILDVNLRGVVHGVQAAYPIMCTQGFGHIVNTASVAGLVATPTFAAYGATKHAVVGLSNALRAEAAAHGVKVSAVCPGFIETALVDNATYLNFDKDKLRANLRFKFMSAETCARHVLRGVARNQRTIVITTHGRWLYRLQRFFPGLVARIAVREVERARKLARVQLADADANASTGGHAQTKLRSP